MTSITIDLRPELIVALEACVEDGDMTISEFIDLAVSGYFSHALWEDDECPHCPFCVEECDCCGFGMPDTPTTD